MATSMPPPSQLKGIWKTLSEDKLIVILKFGFYQKPKEYSMNDATPIIDRLYRDAEEWLRSMPNPHGHGQLLGSYTFYLFRIPTSDCTLIPILRQSDIEHNCLIEIILVPVESSRNAHSLYKCQLNVPTSCSRCTRFIAGLYRQGYRCRKCRRTFHKNCASLGIDDCPVDSNGDQSSSPRRSSPSNTTTLTLINSYTTEMGTSNNEDTNRVSIFRTTITTAKEKPEEIQPNKIIEKGIFPACLRGSHISRRYLFRLTTSLLSISSNLSQSNIEQMVLNQPDETETVFPLTDIAKLVLTHIHYDRNDIFEIHFNDRTVISVGKRTDSDELQMETAQFYSSIREQRETLINATPQTPPTTPTRPVPGQQQPPKPTTNSKNPPLAPKKSNFSIAPKNQDLHELYEFTGEKIGQGAFGRVVGARKKSNGEDVAIKIIEKSNCDEREITRINGEINNLYKFNHMNILKFQAYYERDDAVYLVTERMETDLCKYIMNKKPVTCLNESLAKIVIYQLLVAVRYLHGENCGHLDIKCDNILLTLLKPRPSTTNDNDSSQEYPLVKLADFGYSRIIGEHSFRKTRVGTRVYNAPEVNHGSMGYNRSADMWSIGMVMFATLSGQLPYDEDGSQNAEKYIQDQQRLFASERWENISPAAKDLIINKLLVVPSSNRIKSNDAIFQNWFTDIDLICHLREIERRTAYLLSTRDEKFPTSSRWLTREREDEVWTDYVRAIAESETIS